MLPKICWYLKVWKENLSKNFNNWPEGSDESYNPLAFLWGENQTAPTLKFKFQALKISCLGWVVVDL